MIGLWFDLGNAWRGLSPVSHSALIAWVLATISLPVARWIWGDRAIRWGVSAGVILQALTVFTTLWGAWGRQAAAVCALAIMGMGQYRPIAPNKPGNGGNEKNRRVEIYIVPAGQIYPADMEEK